MDDQARNDRDCNGRRYDCDHSGGCRPAMLHPDSLSRQAQNAPCTKPPRVSADTIGSILALLLAAAAYLRSRGAGGFYDRDVYGMTASVHRRYGAIALLFAAAFAVDARWFAQSATIWLYAAFVLFAVFYLTSYLRGAHEDDD